MGEYRHSVNTNDSRSPSRCLVRTSCVTSRPPSVPPGTGISSAFDMSRRQRTTSLDAQSSSSWSKCPAPDSRRKCIDGGSQPALSDSEVCNCFYVHPPVEPNCN
ncbi:hypothetical protein C8R48DRAFT_406122 [Suillus tomentosus]|nr:hypothetical protein C8R48DRAFT_406122 [Suillus tomentosus]